MVHAVEESEMGEIQSREEEDRHSLKRNYKENQDELGRDSVLEKAEAGEKGDP